MRFGHVLRAACLLSCLALTPAAAQDATCDVVIKGGRMIDPASGRDEVADVGITGGSIAANSPTASSSYT